MAAASYNLSGYRYAYGSRIQIHRWGWVSGVFNQTGGTHVASNILILAYTPGSRGTYNLSGGNLSAATVQINSGGLFNQTGGNLNATSSLTNPGTYTMAGGTLTGGSLHPSTDSSPPLPATAPSTPPPASITTAP